METRKLDNSFMKLIRFEYAIRKRKCRFCNLIVKPGTECIKVFEVNICVDCFALRMLELYDIKELNKLYNEKFSNWKAERVAHLV